MSASGFGPRRFIAGAVCPACAEMDKTVLYRVSDTEQVRECVRCGHRETLSDDAAATPEEPVTRVNSSRPGEKPLAHEDEIAVVTVLDPADGRNRKDH